VRLSIQGILILLLCCLFIPSVSHAYGGRVENSNNGCEGTPTDLLNCISGTYSWTYTGINKVTTYRARCPVPQTPVINGSEPLFPGHPLPEDFNGSIPTYECQGCSGEKWTHEPHPIHGAPPNIPDCACLVGYTDQGAGSATRCTLEGQQEPEECLEIGQFYNPKDQSCVAECPAGSWPLNNTCVGSADPEPDPDTCDSSSEDFRGNVNQGYGNPPLAICGDTTCTTGGKPGQSGIFNGELVCLAEDHGAPKCKGGTIIVIEEYGFICESVGDEEDTDTSDGDSDEDGEGDLTGIAGQLQDIKALLDQGNTGTGKGLKGLGDKLVDAIGKIPGGGGSGNEPGEGEGETPVNWSGDAIDTELTDPTEDYEQVMADYQAKIHEIKAEVQAMFSTNLTGGGSVDDDIKNIKGVDVNFSLNRFLSGLNILGAIVLFCAAFISAGILFTSRG